jgi:hypothetical protein
MRERAQVYRIGGNTGKGTSAVSPLREGDECCVSSAATARGHVHRHHPQPTKGHARLNTRDHTAAD